MVYPADGPQGTEDDQHPLLENKPKKRAKFAANVAAYVGEGVEEISRLRGADSRHWRAHHELRIKQEHVEAIEEMDRRHGTSESGTQRVPANDEETTTRGEAGERRKKRRGTAAAADILRNPPSRRVWQSRFS